MIVKLGLILLCASAISCALVQQHHTSHVVDNKAKHLNDTKGGACDVCTCTKDPTYNGMYVWCGAKHLKSVPKNVPTDTTSLVLWSNDIANVNPSDVDYLGRLKWLDLTSNSLHSLPSNIFDKLTEIKLLSIRKNHLTALPRDVFKHNTKLTDLYIDDNPLKCSCDLFRTMVNVIPKLNKDGMKYLGRCDGDVDLRTMTPDKEEKFCGKPTTTPVPTTKPRTTKSKGACDICQCRKDFKYDGTYVYCRDRHLTSIPDNIPETTTTLNLFHNSIKTISENTFKNLKKLKYLNLSRNKLITLSKGALRGLSQLERLTLSDNPLTTIEASAFESLESVKEIEMYGDKLKSLPRYLFENTFNLKDLDLSDNELQCNCDLYHVMVDVVGNLHDHVSGSCNGNVELSTLTRDKKDKFCGPMTKTVDD